MCLAIPGQVLSIHGDDPFERTGRVRFGGIIKEVGLACVPEARLGDYVLVHAGLAITTLDEAEAAAALLEFERLQAQSDQTAALGEEPGAGP